MATEIERKYLPADERWRECVTARTLLRQGYLANNERCSVRVRIAGGDVGWLSVKAMTPGLARAEYEYPVPLAEAKRSGLHLRSLCARALFAQLQCLIRARAVTRTVNPARRPARVDCSSP